MGKITIVKREMKPEELQRMYTGFDEHTMDQGVAVQSSDRFSFTAVEGDHFIGCSSGLAYKHNEEYSGWFYLTDLFVEKAFRHQGLGSRLLLTLESEILSVGINHIWTWTAGYEAPEFYQKQGYTIFAEMEYWYSDGSSRVGMKKLLSY